MGVAVRQNDNHGPGTHRCKPRTERRTFRSDRGRHWTSVDDWVTRRSKFSTRTNIFATGNNLFGDRHTNLGSDSNVCGSDNNVSGNDSNVGGSDDNSYTTGNNGSSSHRGVFGKRDDESRKRFAGPGTDYNNAKSELTERSIHRNAPGKDFDVPPSDFAEIRTGIGAAGNDSTIFWSRTNKILK